MSDFFIRIEGTNQQYHFGEMPHHTILNLCEFMRVRQFPQGFFSDMEATSEVTFYLTSATRGEVHIRGQLVFRGEFHNTDSYEYRQFISGLVSELRQQRTELKEDGQDVAEDSIEDFYRGIDYFELFDEFLDELEERMTRALDEWDREGEMELAEEGVTGDKDSKTD
jgi:exonuclease VII small subunit